MKTISDGPLLVSQTGPTARFVLNRPERRNAVSNAMLQTMLDGLQEAIADETVRSILLSGAGPLFSSGRDNREFGQPEPGQSDPIAGTPTVFARVLLALMESPKPTVAAVHGYAYGGGQALTLACDFVVAEQGARFGTIEMTFGFPAAMNIALLTRHLGRRVALEIAMTGQAYTAQRFHELGLVNRLADTGRLDETVDEFLGLLNGREPWAIQRTKQAFRTAGQSPDLAAIHQADQLNMLMFGERLRSVVQPPVSDD